MSRPHRTVAKILDFMLILGIQHKLVGWVDCFVYDNSWVTVMKGHACIYCIYVNRRRLLHKNLFVRIYCLRTIFWIINILQSCMVENEIMELRFEAIYVDRS